jgi:hypothetical protein
MDKTFLFKVIEGADIMYLLKLIGDYYFEMDDL